MFESKKISSILFISVLDEETQPLVSLLTLQPNNLLSVFCNAYEGNYNGIKIYLTQPKKDPKFKVDSIGPEISGIVAYIGIESFNPDMVINFGTAGGVIRHNKNQKGLKIGDVCVSYRDVFFYDRKCSLNENFNDYFVGKYSVLSLGESCKRLNLKETSIGTTSSFISDQKQAFENGVDVCDMECASIAKVCFKMNTPFLAVKVISDLDIEEENDQKNTFESNLKKVSEILARKLKEILNFLSENSP